MYEGKRAKGEAYLQAVIIDRYCRARETIEED
jgi:hypothetical protein